MHSLAVGLQAVDVGGCVREGKGLGARDLGGLGVGVLQYCRGVLACKEAVCVCVCGGGGGGGGIGISMGFKCLTVVLHAGRTDPNTYMYMYIQCV